MKRDPGRYSPTGEDIGATLALAALMLTLWFLRAMLGA